MDDWGDGATMASPAPVYLPDFCQRTDANRHPAVRPFAGTAENSTACPSGINLARTAETPFKPSRNTDREHIKEKTR